MKNILILEDNIKTLTALEMAIQQISGTISVFTAQSYEDACKIAFMKRIDVFILDIILETKTPGDTSGIKFAELIRKHEDYFFTPIIFITVLADPELYAYRNIHSFGYLEKPFSMSQVIELVKDAMKYTPSMDGKQEIYLRKDGILIAVKLKDVVYVSANHHALDIYMLNEMVSIPYMTIKRFLVESGRSGFIQCSRNTAVNKAYIQNLDLTNRYIELSNGTRVEIGMTFCQKIRQEILHV